MRPDGAHEAIGVERRVVGPRDYIGDGEQDAKEDDERGDDGPAQLPAAPVPPPLFVQCGYGGVAFGLGPGQFQGQVRLSSSYAALRPEGRSRRRARWLNRPRSPRRTRSRVGRALGQASFALGLDAAVTGWGGHHLTSMVAASDAPSLAAGECRILTPRRPAALSVFAAMDNTLGEPFAARCRASTPGSTRLRCTRSDPERVVTGRTRSITSFDPPVSVAL